VADLAPALMPVIKGIGEWIAANKEMLRAEITGTIKEMVSALKTADWRGFMADMRSVVAGLRDFVTWAGGVKNVLIGIGALFLAGPIASIVGIVGALWRFGAGLVALAGGWSAIGAAILSVGKALAIVGRLFLLNPIGLVITGLIAGAVLLYTHWDRIKGWFVDFFNWLPERVRALGDLFKSLLPDFSFGGGDLPSSRNTASATPLERSGALNVAAGRQQLNGDMTVRFENAPPGMRAAPGTTNQPGVALNPDVGYRTLSMGL
jgi:hypothetical protein